MSGKYKNITVYTGTGMRCWALEGPLIPYGTACTVMSGQVHTGIMYMHSIPLPHKVTMSTGIAELQKKLDDVVSSLGTARFDVPTISRDEIIQRMQARDPSIVLLDIRTDEERSTTIPGSIDISGEALCRNLFLYSMCVCTTLLPLINIYTMTLNQNLRGMPKSTRTRR